MHPILAEYLKLMESYYDVFSKTIAGLPVEALDWTPGSDMNSLAVLVVHTTGATSFLVGEIAGDIPTNRDRAGEFKTAGWDEAKLNGHLNKSLELVRAVVEKLTVDDLTKTRFNVERNRTYVYAEAIFHALDHTALHVGHAEITRQLWDQGQR